MSNTKRSYEDSVFNELKFIALSPWSVEVECLDILTKDGPKKGLLAKCFGSSDSEQIYQMRLNRQGSMLHPTLVKDIAAWGEDLGTLRKGLDQLKDPKLTVRPSVPGFKKEQLPEVRLVFKNSKRFWALFQAGFSCNSSISAEESLTLTLEGLTTASVPYEKIVDWTDGAWLPNIDRRGLNWSKKPGYVNSIWIVTSVLYATKLTVKGRDGMFAGINVKVPIPIAETGFQSVGARLDVQKEKDNQLMIMAPRKQHFRVGYRAIKLDYCPDGTPMKEVGLEAVGFRGGDDNLTQKHLKCMEQDLFVVDEDGHVASIPLLTPLEEELDVMESTELQH